MQRSARRAVGLAALLIGLGVLVALPMNGPASPSALRALLDGAGDTLVAPALTPPDLAAVESPRERLERLERERRRATQAQAAPLRQQQDPKTEPPAHGTNPHGQGTVGVVDLQPSTTRPQGGDPAGSDSGEEVVVGRARGEQREDGTYHGHVTILALFGQEILGTDTNPGQSDAGPLDPIQQNVLNPLCDGSGEQVCISAVTADSSTDANGSTNRFSAAHVTIGGANGIDAGAAESNGNISSDGTCQTSHGDSSVASAKVGGQAVADLAQSSTDSRACKGQAPVQANASQVLALGGTGVPLPDPGCANNTPNVVTGIPTVAPIVCNADDTNGNQAEDPYGVREALGVYVLDSGGSQAAKTTTSASESRAVAPPAQCSDKIDNDGDGAIDAPDPGCLSGPGGTYNPNDDDETNPATQCSDTVDNDGDGVADAQDPGCLSGPGGTYNPSDDDEANAATQCSDTVDNDGDGVADARDPGCLSGPGGAYNPADDDETNPAGSGRQASKPACSDTRDNDGDGLADARDPGCLSGPGGTYDPDDESEANRPGDGRPACSDGVDNDGDGEADRDDPGCLSGPGGTYNPDDDDESDARQELGALALTGADALLLAIGGLCLLGFGLALRRRTELGIGV